MNKQPPLNNTVDALIKRRQASYGTFAQRATLLVALRTLISEHMHTCNSQHSLSDAQTVALGDICNKISRIVNGDPNVIDSWRDIEGYAALIRLELEGQQL